MALSMWPKWPSCPYMVITLLAWTQQADDIQTRYTATKTWAVQSFSNDDTGLALPYFTAGSTLLPNAFVWENVTNGTNKWLNENINTYEYKRSRSLFDLCPRSLRFVISNDIGHMTKMEPCPYRVKFLKHFLSETKWWKCDCWMTFIFCRERSNLLAWEID